MTNLPSWLPADETRLLAAFLVVLGYLLFTKAVLRAHRRRQIHAQDAGATGSDSGGRDMLIAYASQTGFAERLAQQTAQSLTAGGVTARVRSLAKISVDELRNARQALFIVSTTGEGDAPDQAMGFARKVMTQSSPLSTLSYGLLALGDRSYRNFCGFGHAFENWLRRHEAKPLFDMIEVDNGDEGALRHWQHHLGVLSGNTELPDWQTPQYERWRLSGRRLLNPGSAGGPCFHIELQPVEGTPRNWSAGDVVEIGPRNAGDDVQLLLRALDLDGDFIVRHAVNELALRELLASSHLPSSAECRGLTAQQLADRLTPLPHREYSIASLPEDGAIHLLIRQMRHPDGRPGIGSGWLTMHADPGAEVALRIRANPNFHAPQDERPLILIGNGTGLAGLRGLLKTRIAAGHHRNWLLFGERNAAHDYFHCDEIQSWLARGFIERLDLAFSRDQVERIYVQHRLIENAALLRDWVSNGAAIYVCGSQQGMAPGVHAALAEILGAVPLEQLTEDGRYRRDVY